MQAPSVVLPTEPVTVSFLHLVHRFMPVESL